MSFFLIKKSTTIMSFHDKKSTKQHNDAYPYIGFMLHGKNDTENTNWEAEGDNLSLSFNW